MLALAMYRKTRCPHCGGDMVESTDIANDGKYRPLLPLQCHRCVAFSQSHEAYKDAPHLTSLHHRVELRR